MGLWHVGSGAVFAIGWFIFFDGLAIAKKPSHDHPYQFVAWLPGILSCLAMFMFSFIDAKALRGDDDMDMFGGGGDQSAEFRSKIIFFFASFIGLAGISVGVWQLSAEYTGKDTWPGIALVLQCVAILTSCGLLFMARFQKKEDELM